MMPLKPWKKIRKGSEEGVKRKPRTGQQWKSNVSNFLSIISTQRLHWQYVTACFAIASPINLTGFSPPLCIVSLAVRGREENLGKSLQSFCDFVVELNEKKKNEKNERYRRERYKKANKRWIGKVLKRWRKTHVRTNLTWLFLLSGTFKFFLLHWKSSSFEDLKWFKEDFHFLVK